MVQETLQKEIFIHLMYPLLTDEQRVRFLDLVANEPKTPDQAVLDIEAAEACGFPDIADAIRRKWQTEGLPSHEFLQVDYRHVDWGETLAMAMGVALLPLLIVLSRLLRREFRIGERV